MKPEPIVVPAMLIAIATLFSSCRPLGQADDSVSRQVQSDESDQSDPLQPAPDFNDLSMVSCASCHGSHDFLDAENPDDRWQSAYQIWASRDPHARAYRTLRNDESRRMVLALGQNDNGRDSAAWDSLNDRQRHQSILDQRCVTCHSAVPADRSMDMYSQSGLGGSPASSFLAEGVSCHACHSGGDLNNRGGNPWIELHALQSWADGLHDRAQAGLRDLTDHHIRAQVCAACHLGSENRDVNHDLIAAGHPRLVFEYSSLLSRLPKHWSEKTERNLHVECWSIGQVEAAKSSLSLLATRARSALDSRAPWPEFAEYNCHHCHHALKGNWYIPTEAKLAGNPAWSCWSHPEDFAETGNLDQMRQLRLEMHRPLPDATTIIRLADPATELALDSHPIGYLRTCLNRQPQLNSDELFAWYLAVASCLRDADSSDAGVGDVQSMMGEFKMMLDVPFELAKPAQVVDVERLQQLLSEIRTGVLVILDRQQKLGNRQP